MYHGTIIQIDDCLVSEEILTEYFACYYEKCKGCCCVIGDSGAPLEEAKSWSKAKHGSNLVTVIGDVTIIFPLIMASVLDKLED